MNGESLIKIGEFFSLFIVIKALWEMRMTAISNFNNDESHRRAHIAALGCIATYSLYDIFSFIWFKDMTVNWVDYTIAFFNIFALNITWLFVIDHFKQERKGEIKRSTWFELFKF